MKIYFAPLEGITTYIFRNAYEKAFSGIDKYFAPFISPADHCAMNPKERRDVLPENNKGLKLIPQILTCRSEHFIDAANVLKEMGYQEINLNLGCPSGTVCAKGKGAGFLRDIYKLECFLDDIYNYAEREGIAISLKTRLGYVDPEEFYDLLEVYNEYPVRELIIHPRIRTEFYKGTPRLEYIRYAKQHSKNPIVYNGDILMPSNIEDYGIADLESCMIGRGLLSSPWLAKKLQGGGQIEETEGDFNAFWMFHDEIYHAYQEIMSPDINVLYRMKELWTYWKVLFPGYEREVKKIMKSKYYHEYESAILLMR